MFFKSVLRKAPYVGNLIKTSYQVRSRIASSARVMPCNYVKLQKGEMVVTASELHDAHVRFVKYGSQLPDNTKNLKNGVWMAGLSFQTRRVGNVPPSLGNLIYLSDEIDSRVGYIFSNYVCEEISQRTLSKIKETRIKPTVFQRFVIFVNKCLGNL